MVGIAGRGVNGRTRQKVMIRSGRDDHVTCHHAKDDHPVKTGMAGDEGMATDSATRI